MRLNRRTIALRTGTALALVSLLAACNVSGSGYTPAAHPSNGTFTTSTSASVTLPSLTASGITVSGSAPAANAAVSVTETLSTTAPSGVSALKARREASASLDVLLYVTFSSTSTVTLTASPALTFASSSITPGTSYYLGEIAGSGTWTAPFTGPQTASGDSVSFPSVTTPVTISSGAPVTFALYSGTAPTPTPSPTPAASPASLLFDATAPGASQTFAVSEAGYSGTFTGTMTCTENPAGQTPPASAFVAEFSNGTATATATPASAGAAATFTVMGGAETGSCTATVSDSNLNSVAVGITVSTTSVTIDRVNRRGTYIRLPGRE